MPEPDFDFDIAFQNAVHVLSEMLETARSRCAFPLALIIQGPEGFSLLISAGLPTSVLPTAAEWAALRPNGNPTQTLDPVDEPKQ